MPANIDLSIDVRGQCCPVPLIEISKAIARLTQGQVVAITGNDPTFEVAMNDYCQVNGHIILEVSILAEDQSVCVLVEVGSD